MKTNFQSKSVSLERAVSLGPTPLSRVNNDRGSVLIYVLWFIAILSVLITGVAQNARIDTRLFLNNMEQTRLQWAAKGGVERAIAVLADDSTDTDSFTDLWYDNELDLLDIQIGDCTVDIEIIDEASKLNINSATKNQLKTLPNIDEPIIATIMDWRDKDQNIQAHGVEGAYYDELEPPYPIRNGPFQTLRELLLVKDVTSEHLYGEDINQNGKLDYNENDGEMTMPSDNADGLLEKGWASWLTTASSQENKNDLDQARVNLTQTNENELQSTLEIPKKYAKWIYQNHKNARSIGDLISKSSPKNPEEASAGDSTPIDLQTYAEIVDKITVSKEETLIGLVNINTASKQVLYAITEGDEELSDNIIAFREENIFPIDSIADIIFYDEIGISGFKKIADKITVRSNIFSVRVTAKADQTEARLSVEAILKRTADGAEILYWYQGAEI